jgi:hypothetical protein
VTLLSLHRILTQSDNENHRPLDDDAFLPSSGLNDEECQFIVNEFLPVSPLSTYCQGVSQEVCAPSPPSCDDDTSSMMMMEKNNDDDLTYEMERLQLAQEKVDFYEKVKFGTLTFKEIVENGKTLREIILEQCSHDDAEKYFPVACEAVQLIGQGVKFEEKLHFMPKKMCHISGFYVVLYHSYSQIECVKRHLSYHLDRLKSKRIQTSAETTVSTLYAVEQASFEMSRRLLRKEQQQCNNNSAKNNNEAAGDDITPPRPAFSHYN